MKGARGRRVLAEASMVLGGLTIGTLGEVDTGSVHNLIFKVPLGGDGNWFLSSRNLLATRDGFDDLFFGHVDLNLDYKLGDKWAVERYEGACL